MARRGRLFLWLVGILSRLGIEDEFDLDEEMRKACLGDKYGGRCSDKQNILKLIDIMHREFTTFKRYIIECTEEIVAINAKGDSATEEDLLNKKLYTQRLFALDKIGVEYEEIWFTLNIQQQYYIILKKAAEQNIFPRMKYLNTQIYLTPDYDDNLMWQRRKVMASETRMNNSRERHIESYNKLPLLMSRAELKAGLKILKKSDDNLRLHLGANQLLREQILKRLAEAEPQDLPLLEGSESDKDEGPKDDESKDEGPKDEDDESKDEGPKDEDDESKDEENKEL